MARGRRRADTDEVACWRKVGRREGTIHNWTATSVLAVLCDEQPAQNGRTTAIEAVESHAPVVALRSNDVSILSKCPDYAPTLSMAYPRLDARRG